MNVRHLKIGPNAVVTMSQSRWDALLARTTGHVLIAPNARLTILPDEPEKEGRTIQSNDSS